MKTVALERTSPAFRKTTRLARRGVVVLTEKGKAAFAIVGVGDDLALEALALSRNAKFMAYLDEVRERAKNGRTYSLAEIRAEFKLPPKRSGPAAKRKK
ncbi:MAG: hypothetical protein HY023_04685 [Chloroflexi bacterium]|nr:hypothetical protein [Chloroflexota bacterium]